ncbi:MAG: hypothetical protein R6V06_09695 [Kiritimatiellia bacterium]
MKIRQKNNGSVLLVTIGITTIISMTLAFLHVMAKQQIHSTIRTKDSLKARMIAESGLNFAYNMIRNDFDQLRDFTIKSQFDDGNYTVIAKTFSDNLVNRAQLASVGTCGSGKSTVAADLENCPVSDNSGSSDDDSYSLDFDVHVGGQTDMGSNFHSDVNDIFSNGNIEIKKGSTLDENVVVSSAGTVTWGKKNDPPPAGATINSGQPPQEVYPASLEAAITAYIEYAEINGSVYTSGSDIPSSPPGGVGLYTGTEPLILHGTYNGTIIALGGRITINAGTVISGLNGAPSLISLSPDSIKINGGATMHGALLAPNSAMSLQGTAAFHGPLLVGQDIKGSGTADLYAGTGQGFSMPMLQEEIGDNVVVISWH